MAKAKAGTTRGTMNDISAEGTRSTKVAAYAFAALVVLSAAWLALAMTTFFVGPAEWDDTGYCNKAAEATSRWWVVNRYIHIWTLRLFFLVIESRQTAAGLYSALTVVGLMGVAFLLGWRISGSGCGLVAAALMPFYPVVLKYMTVPYADEPAALWSGAALVCALVALERTGSRAGWLAVVGTGLFCFLSVKCKETGLAVLPAVCLVLWSRQGKLKTLGQWAGGLLAGWTLLTFLDLVFTDDMWFSWRPSVYFHRKAPSPGAKPTIRMGMEYIEFLSSRHFLAFSLLGVAGGLASFRENRTVRCVSVWLFAVIGFQSLIATRYSGIQALDRYCVGIGVPLVILSSHWIVMLWQRSVGGQRGYSIGVVLALVVIVGPAVYGLAATVTEGLDAKSRAGRAYFYLVPMSIVLLFAVPWLTWRRLLVRASLVVLVAIACTLSVDPALRYVQRSETKLAPWIQLAAELDGTGAGLAKWNMPRKPLMYQRIGWRCRVFSKKPPEHVRTREVASLDEIKDNEWLFTDLKWWQTDTPERQQMLAKGWRPFLQGFEGRQGFVVCRRQ